MSSNVSRGFNNGRTNVRSGYQNSKANSVDILKWLVIIVIACLLFVLVFKIIEWASGKKNTAASNSPVLISNAVDAWHSDVANKSYKVTSTTQGLAYSYSMWIYVADWNYNFGNLKNVMVRSNDRSTAASPDISFDRDLNNLVIRQSYTGGAKSGNVDFYCDIKNFPLQKWVNLIVVLNNRTMDTYVNGKLERSCVIPGVPYIANTAPVKFAQATGGSKLTGFFGKLSQCQYFNYAIQQDEILKLFNAGPYTATDYNIVFFKNGKFIQFKDANSDPQSTS